VIDSLPGYITTFQGFLGLANLFFPVDYAMFLLVTILSTRALVSITQFLMYIAGTLSFGVLKK
jgi:hypothetical protein